MCVLLAMFYEEMKFVCREEGLVRGGASQWMASLQVISYCLVLAFLKWFGSKVIPLTLWKTSAWLDGFAC